MNVTTDNGLCKYKMGNWMSATQRDTFHLNIACEYFSVSSWLQLPKCKYLEWGHLVPIGFMTQTHLIDTLADLWILAYP